MCGGFCVVWDYAHIVRFQERRENGDLYYVVMTGNCAGVCSKGLSSSCTKEWDWAPPLVVGYNFSGCHAGDIRNSKPFTAHVLHIWPEIWDESTCDYCYGSFQEGFCHIFSPDTHVLVLWPVFVWTIWMSWRLICTRNIFLSDDMIGSVPYLTIFWSDLNKCN